MNPSTLIHTRPGIMVGAWGYKFFETDHDYNIVAHLGADMGLLPQNEPLPRGVDRRRQDSLLNSKNRVFIVKYFGEDYHYNRVFNTYMQRLRDYKVIDVGATLKEEYMSDSPRYYLVILGLLAMQLGCSLKSEHRRWMKANYQACLPLYERFEQAKMAVFEYEDSKPLKLDSKTVQEKMVDLANLPGEQLINVPNVALELSMMRMHMDNQAAQAVGGTTDKGVDISKSFNSEADIPALEKAAADKAKSNAYYNMPGTPELPVQNAKFSLLSLGEDGDASATAYAAFSGAPVEKLDNEDVAEILIKLGSVKVNNNGDDVFVDGAGLCHKIHKSKRNRNSKKNKPVPSKGT